MPSVIILSFFQYDMTCHGRQPESINTTLTLNNGSQMQIDSPKLNETGRLDYLLEFSVDNTPCGINVTIKNQFGNNHTYVLLGKLDTMSCNTVMNCIMPFIPQQTIAR